MNLKILLAVLSILFFLGCGKSTEQKKTEKVKVEVQKTKVADTISVVNINGIKWQKLDKGLLFKEFPVSKKSSVTKVKPYNIVVLKIDTKKFKFDLISSSEVNVMPQHIIKWSERTKHPILFNAGMFDMDMVSNVGFMKNFDHYNNENYTKSYKSFIVFNPRNDTLPVFDIIDVGSENEMKEIEKNYNTVIQNLRMIGKGKNKWTKKSSKTRFSELCLGVDDENNCFVIFTRAPYHLYEFNEMLLKLPLNLKKVCHLEGGPEASLFINYNHFKRNFKGSYEDGFNENDQNHHLYELPNIIGIRKR